MYLDAKEMEKKGSETNERSEERYIQSKCHWFSIVLGIS